LRREIAAESSTNVRDAGGDESGCRIRIRVARFISNIQVELSGETLLAMSLLHRRYRWRRSNLHMVMELRAEDNYTLWLRFDDGVEGRVYLADLVDTMPFGALSSAERFSRVAIDPVANVITWEGGINIDPEPLYRDIMSNSHAPLH
jgi:hypothetical protein